MAGGLPEICVTSLPCGHSPFFAAPQDLARRLVAIAKERQPSFLGHGRIQWRVGDMLDPALGRFDHVVAMDSLIHYRPEDIVSTIVALAERCDRSIVFTHAPATPMLRAMHTAGLLFPRSDRAPAIVPVAEPHLARLLREAFAATHPDLRIATSFQSRFGRAKWLEPATDDVIKAEAAKGTRRIAIAATGFSSDCLETIEELGIRGREDFEEAGGTHFAALTCLNAGEAGMDMLEALVRRELSGWI
jgi:hypothetical protein